VGSAHAAYLLGDDGAIVMDGQPAVILSLTKRGELIVGGLGSQDHFVRVEPLVQIGVPKFTDVLVEPVNRFVVARKEILAAVKRAAEIHQEDSESRKHGFINLYYADSKIVASTSRRDDSDAIREDMDREIPYLRASGPSMFTRTMVYRPSYLLEAIAALDGEEITLAYPKNASGKDPVSVFGSDERRIVMVMPIYDDAKGDCDAGTC
jgi:DNA polymerase III sliding clamp (beta) subunit (PCNA family)